MKYNVEKDQTEKHVDLDDKEFYNMDREDLDNDSLDEDFPEEDDPTD